MASSYKDAIDEWNRRRDAEADTQSPAVSPAVSPDEQTAPDTDYRSIIKNLNAGKADLSLDAANDVNPDTAAEMNATAKKLGSTPEIVETDYQAAIKELKRREDAAALTDRPKTQDLLAKPDRARVASDDVSVLAEIEKTVTGAPQAIASGFLQPFSAAPSGFARLRSAYRKFESEQIGDIRGDSWREFSKSIDEFFGQLGKDMKKFGESIELSENEKNYTLDVLQAGGQLTGQAATFAVPYVGPALGMTMLVAAGADETGEILDKTPGGSDTDRFLALALGGATTGVLEKIGIDKLIDGIGVGKNIKNRFTRFLVDRTLGGAAIEVTEETAEAALRDGIVKLLVDPKREILEDFTAYEASVAGGAGGLFRSVLGIRRARSTGDDLRKQIEMARQSKLLGRDPEAFEEFYQSLVDGTESDEVRVSVEGLVNELNQTGGDPVEFLTTLGVDLAEAQKALDNGGDISVNRGKFVTEIAASEGRDDILRHVRSEDASMTVAEAEAESEVIKNRVDEIVTQFNETGEMPAAPTPEIATQAEEIGARIAEQIDASGKYTRQGSKAIGSVYEALFRTIASDYAAEGKEFDLEGIAAELGVNVRSIPFADRASPVTGDETLGTPQAVEQSGFEDYRGRVDPDGRTIPAEDRPNLGMGDMYGMLPEDAEVVSELDDGITIYRGPNGDYYATALNPDLGEQDVVGYIQGGDNGTELAVVQEMQGRGIGSELQYLFRSENPFAPTGGLTEAGARRLEGTYNRLYDEGVITPEELDLQQTALEFDVSPEVLRAELDAAGGDITQTPRFKEWFGDSKIVDADGNPTVVYHGTQYDIEAFNVRGWSSQLPSTPERDEYTSLFGPAGMYFSADPLFARTYAGTTFRRKAALGDAGPVMYPVYLSLQNPKIIKDLTFWEEMRARIKDARDGLDAVRKGISEREMRLRASTAYLSVPDIKKLEAEGYDGIINPKANEIIAFRPEQIKSQMNRGAFDPADPNILNQQSPGFQEFFEGSKIVDKNGAPLRLYHGTDAVFNAFQTGRAGGIYFTDNPGYAEGYGQVKPYYLNVKNPLDLSVRDGVPSNPEHMRLATEWFDGMGGFSIYAEQGGDDPDTADPRDYDREDFGFYDQQDPSWTMWDVPEYDMRGWAQSQGFDGVILNETLNTEEYAETYGDADSVDVVSYAVFDNDQIRQVEDQSAEGELFQRDEGLQDDGGHQFRISTRLPTNVRAQEDPVAENLIVDLEAMRFKPAAFKHNMELVKKYPGFSTRSRNPDKIAEEFLEFTTNNLLWLFDSVPPETRERSKLWYDGARAMSERLAEDHGIPVQSVAAVMAALSPQKDWYQNASLGERVIDIHMHFTQGNAVAFLPDNKMKATARRIFPKDKDKAQRLLVMRSTYSDLTEANDKAMWLRIYDETYNPRGFRVLSPEGEFVGEATGKVAWGSKVEIEKAVAALEDPSLENLTAIMGAKHKVRNFYNNILAPNAPAGDVTIDTHAVAAALTRALSGGSAEVHHNFGSSPGKDKQPKGWQAAKNINDNGAQGTYGIYAEAYRRAAKLRGVSPRELQSITWEAARGLFTAKFKQNAKNVEAIDAIWYDYQRGKIDLDEARNRILETADGINQPDWVDQRDTSDATLGDTSYAGELAGIRVSRRGPRRLDAGSGDPDRTGELFQEDDGGGVARLYSAARRATQSLKQEKATAQQWLSHFKKSGVKDDEIMWIVGLEEFLNSQKGSVSRDDVRAFVDQNGIQVRETVLDTKPPPVRKWATEVAIPLAERYLIDEGYTLEAGEAGTFIFQDDFLVREGLTDAEVVEYAESLDFNIGRPPKQEKPAPKFTTYSMDGDRENDQEFYLNLPADLSTGNASVKDWTQPVGHRIGEEVSDNRNIIRIRVNTRILEDGRKVLFIEEMQDDRGQAARDLGAQEETAAVTGPDTRFDEIETSAARFLTERGWELREEDDGFTDLYDPDGDRVIQGVGGGDILGTATDEGWVEPDDLGAQEETEVVTRPDDFNQLEASAAEFLQNQGYRFEGFRGAGTNLVDPNGATFLGVDAPGIIRLAEGEGWVNPSVPPRPFMGSNKVLPLALKRMIIEAVEQGQDAIAWTPGDVQNDRYNLRRVVDKLNLYLHDDTVTLHGIKDGNVRFEQDVKDLDDLSSLIGKDRAEKMFAELKASETNESVLEGDDLAIGGEGMRKYYDQMAVSQANKIGKKFGAKVEVGQTRAGDNEREFYSEFDRPGMLREAGYTRDQYPDTDEILQITQETIPFPEPVFAETLEAESRELEAKRMDLELAIFDEMRDTDFYQRVEENRDGFFPRKPQDFIRAIQNTVPDTVLSVEEFPGYADLPAAQKFLISEYLEVFFQRAETDAMAAYGEQYLSRLEIDAPTDGYPLDLIIPAMGVDTNVIADRALWNQVQGALEKSQDVWTLPITDKMREAVLGTGLPLFQDPPAGPLGSFNPTERVINLFENADQSTLLHESGHAFVDILGRLVARGDAPARIVDNYNAMLNWVGAESANDLNLNINGDAAREKQERLAMAFEAYLMEGQAPSAELQSAFQMFRQWLINIYRRVRRLEVEVDPTISAVFDRMLATDNEIAEMEQVNAFDFTASPSVTSIMSDEERARHDALSAAASEAARNERVLEERAAEAREQQAWWQEEYQNALERAEAAVYERPEYKAYYFLTKGEFYNGNTPANLEGRRISKQALLDLGYTQQQLNSLPRGARRIYTTKEEAATDPELFAAYFGFADTNEMMDVFLSMRPAKDAIEFDAGTIMRSEHGDPMNDGTMERITEERLFNDERYSAIEMELNALATQTGQQPVGRRLVKAIVDRVFAEETVGGLLTPMRYQAASVRAAREAERAAAKGDFEKAFMKKRQQLLNHEMFRRSLQARDEIQKISQKMKTYQRKKYSPKQVDPEYIGEIKSFLSFFEFGQRSKTGQIKAEQAKALMDFIEARQAKGMPIILPGELVEVASLDPETGEPKVVFKTKHWRDMTMPEIRGLRDMADNLYKIGRDNSAEKKAERRARGEELADGILASTSRRQGRKDPMAMPTLKEQRRQANAWNFLAGHRKMESLLYQLDGFKDLGPMWRAVFEKLARASDVKTQLTQRGMGEMESALEVYDSRTRKTFSDQRSALPINKLGGYRFTREQRVMIALNWGSESSREAILADDWQKKEHGALWNEEAIQEILETLDAADLQFIKQVWTNVDNYWEDVKLGDGSTIKGIKSLEMEQTGIAPPKVEASPFMIGDVEMPGGYYPLVYNNMSDRRAAKESEQDLMNKLQSGGFSRAATSHGFTIARVGSGGRPVLLSLTSLSRHMDEMTQDLSYREAVQQAAEVLGNNSVQDAIVSTTGEKYRKALEDILLSTANGQLLNGDSFIDPIFRFARLNVTTAVMGLNLRSVLTQPLGLSQSVARIGVKEVANGVAWFYRDLTKLPTRAAEIQAMSPYMADRAKTMTRELNEMTNDLGNERKFDNIRAKGYTPMVVLDVYSVAYPTWWGAYNQAMNGRVDGIDVANERDAIMYADNIVRSTQGSGGAQNLSMVQQRSELSKLISMFYGYFNTTYNLQSQAWQKARADGSSKIRAATKIDFLGQTLILQLIPALLGDFLLNAWPDDEEREEDEVAAWAKWSLKAFVNYTGAQIVGVRDLVGGITSDFGYSISPAQGYGEGMVRGAKGAFKIIQALTDEDEDFDEAVSANTIKGMARSIGYLGGIPGTNQLIRMGDYAYKYSQDELKTEPEDFIDIFRGAVMLGDR